MMKAYRFDQIQLVAAITQELSRQRPGLPADHRINVVIEAANRIIAEYERQPVPASQNMGLLAWLDSDDTGLSSVYMAYVLCEAHGITWPINEPPKQAYPRDADDFGRCIRLIDAVPEFGGLVPETAHHGPHWKVISTCWDRWRRLYSRQNYALLNSEMREAFAKAGDQ